LNYGNPEIPEQLWQLEEGTKGIADASKEVLVEGEPVPIISGNVSLYNSKPDGSSIDPTAVVSCTGVITDARKAVTMQVRHAGSALYLIGERRDECGGSLYYQVLEEHTGAKRDTLLGANVPQPKFQEVSSQIRYVAGAIGQGLATACHDISEGGLLLSLFEMLTPQRKIGGKIGAAIDLDAMRSTLRSDQLLFSETGGFLLEIPKGKEQAFESYARENDTGVFRIGATTQEATLHIARGGKTLMDAALSTFIGTWKTALEQRW
jgi:phosphoribosylformylglycinamidine synthase